MMTIPIINGNLYIILFIYFRIVKYIVLPSQKKKVYSIRAFTVVELKSYNVILALLIYQKYLAAVEVKQNFFADLLQCTSIYRCAL